MYYTDARCSVNFSEQQRSFTWKARATTEPKINTIEQNRTVFRFLKYGRITGEDGTSRDVVIAYSIWLISYWITGRVDTYCTRDVVQSPYTVTSAWKQIGPLGSNPYAQMIARH